MAVPARNRLAGTTWTGAGLITGRDDVHRILTDVTQRADTRAITGQLRTPVRRAAQLVDDDATAHLPAHPQLQRLLPSPGLRRGSVIAVLGSTSLLYALLATPMGNGSYAAVVGVPALGLAAAAEHPGLDLNRLALVPDPGPDWPAVVAALLDGVDLVAIGSPVGEAEVSPRIAASLAARARRAGSVLVPLGAWPNSDLTLSVDAHRWTGLAQGRGRLRHHEVDISVRGRGAASRPRSATLAMPLPSTYRESRVLAAPAPQEANELRSA